MKYSAGIIAALAVLICQNEASSVDEINNLLTKSRNISTSVQSLMIKMTEQEDEKFRQISLTYSQSLENIMAEIKRTKDYVRKELSPEAVERCDKSFNYRFGEIYVKYVDLLMECKNKADRDRTSEQIADQFQNVGKALEAKIENIKSNCSDPDLDVSEQCLEKYLPELTLSVQSYETDYIKLRFGRYIPTAHVPFNFDDCLSVLNRALRNKLKSERVEGAKCDSIKFPSWLLPFPLSIAADLANIF